MSFAEEMGHDIPPDDWMDDGWSNQVYSGDYPKRWKGGGEPKLTECSNIKIEHKTKMAWLIIFKDERMAWVPMSQGVLTKNSIVIPIWLKNKLIYI